MKRTLPKPVEVSPENQLGTLKLIGGSANDAFNSIVANQAMKSLWVAHSDSDSLDKQYQATIHAMVGIGPKDEIEGMMAAQMIGLHNAAMECMRRAMLAEQTFEGRRESLNQANKLTRSYATLVEALNRHGARASSGSPSSTSTSTRAAKRSSEPSTREGEGDRPKLRINLMQPLPMNQVRRCRARS